MEAQSERDRRELAWLRADVARAARLTDADRVGILRDLLRTVAAVRKNKSADEIRRDEEVRRALDAPGRARYRRMIERLG